MSTMLTSITILLVFIIRSIVSEDSSPPTAPCTVEVTGLEDARPFVFFFDQDEMDRILGRTNWDEEAFMVYLVRGDERTRTIRIQRDKPSLGEARGRIDPLANAMPGDWQIGDVFAIVDEQLNCQPSNDLECARFTCDSVDRPEDGGSNGAVRRVLTTGTGYQCNFDINAVDTILDNERWGTTGPTDGIFPIYNHRTMTIRYARLRRDPNGGSLPTEDRGYLDILVTDMVGSGPMAGDWEVDDQLSFIGTSTICDPDCENDYPLFDTFLDECSEQYAMDRLSIDAELERLNRRTNLNTLGLFALGLKTKILLRKLSFCCGGGSSDSSDSSDSWDSSNSGKTGHGGSKLLSTSENLNIINAYLEMIADEISLDGLGELGKLLNAIQQEMEMND